MRYDRDVCKPSPFYVLLGAGIAINIIITKKINDIIPLCLIDN